MERLYRRAGMFNDKLRLEGEIIQKTGVMIAPAPVANLQDWMKTFAGGLVVDSRKEGIGYESQKIKGAEYKRDAIEIDFEEVEGE